MKALKSVLAITLLCVLCLGLCACGKPQDPWVGHWTCQYTYNGASYLHVIGLTKDGTFYENLFKNGKSPAIQSSRGDYTVDGNDITLESRKDLGFNIPLTYHENGTLTNGDHVYTK